MAVSIRGSPAAWLFEFVVPEDRLIEGETVGVAGSSPSRLPSAPAQSAGSSRCHSLTGSIAGFPRELLLLRRAGP